MATRSQANIYSVTLNPALDLSGHVQTIIPNEKNSVSRPRLDPGGNAINAARIAKRLGHDPVLMGFLGGAAGNQLSELLDQEGVRHRFTPISGITRTNVTVTNDSSHEQTRLSFPGPVIKPTETRALVQFISKLRYPGVLVLGGSMPPGCPKNYYSVLIRRGVERGLGIVLDVPSKDLKEVLEKSGPRLLLIKPNRIELEGFAGKKLATDAAISEEAIRLSRRSALVCVSLGSKGALAAAQGKSWRIYPPKVRAKGTVGAGDSMVGAITACLLQRGIFSPELCDLAPSGWIVDALRWGAAAGAATAATEGTSLGTADLIRRLRPQVRVEPLFRS
jgi:1-phosphofructokinase family hexose kinase